MFVKPYGRHLSQMALGLRVELIHRIVGCSNMWKRMWNPLRLGCMKARHLDRIKRNALRQTIIGTHEGPSLHVCIDFKRQGES